MGAGDQLRQAGGAAGQQEDGYLSTARLVGVPAFRLRGFAGVGAQRGEVDRARASTADHEHVLEGRAQTQLLGHRLVVESAQHARDRNRPRLAVVDEVLSSCWRWAGRAMTGTIPARRHAKVRTTNSQQLGSWTTMRSSRSSPRSSTSAVASSVRPGHETGIGEPHVAVDECHVGRMRVGDRP